MVAILLPSKMEIGGLILFLKKWRLSWKMTRSINEWSRRKKCSIWKGSKLCFVERGRLARLELIKMGK